jgi:hypothetical protein
MESFGKRHLIELSLCAALSACRADERDINAPELEMCTPSDHGFWHLGGYSEGGSPEEVATKLENVAAETGMTTFVIAQQPSYALSTLLPAARSEALGVLLRMSPEIATTVDAEGNFDMDAWSEGMQAWADPVIQSETESYVQDGTLVANLIADDTANCPGEDPTAKELNDMASLSHRIFPDLTTIIRADATELPEGSYEDLDQLLLQYKANKKDEGQYKETNINATDDLGLDRTWGLNITNGGNGSSEQAGTIKDQFTMSPKEIHDYTEELLTDPDSKGFLNWQLDEGQVVAHDGTTIDFHTKEYTDAFNAMNEHPPCD